MFTICYVHYLRFVGCRRATYDIFLKMQAHGGESSAEPHDKAFRIRLKLEK